MSRKNFIQTAKDQLDQKRCQGLTLKGISISDRSKGEKEGKETSTEGDLGRPAGA